MKRKGVLTLVSLGLLIVLMPAFVFGGGKQEGKKAEDRPIVADGWLRKWDGVSLVLSTHQGPNTDAYKEMGKEFERITGAKVTVLDESWTDLLSKHLASSAAHDGAYDLVTFFYGWFGHYVEGGLLQDLNKWFARTGLADPAYAMEDFIPAVLEVYGRYKAGFFKDPNALWAVPFKFDVYTAQYRADLFERPASWPAGKEPPATWDELVADAKVLAKKYPDITPVVMPLAVDDPMVSTYLPIICSYGAKKPNPWYDANLYPEFQKEPGVKAIRAAEGADAVHAGGRAQLRLRQGEHADGPGEGGLRTELERLPTRAAGPVQVEDRRDACASTTPPAGSEGGRRVWAAGRSACRATRRTRRRPSSCCSSSPAGRTAVSLAMKGGSVARFSAVNDPQVVAKFPYYPLLVEGAKDAVARGSDRSWTEIQRILGVELNKILLGAEEKKGLEETARKVFDAAQQAGYNPEKIGRAAVRPIRRAPREGAAAPSPFQILERRM